MPVPSKEQGSCFSLDGAVLFCALGLLLLLLLFATSSLTLNDHHLLDSPTPCNMPQNFFLDTVLWKVVFNRDKQGEFRPASSSSSSSSSHPPQVGTPCFTVHACSSPGGCLSQEDCGGWGASPVHTCLGPQTPPPLPSPSSAVS